MTLYSLPFSFLPWFQIHIYLRKWFWIGTERNHLSQVKWSSMVSLTWKGNFWSEMLIPCWHCAHKDHLINQNKVNKIEHLGKLTNGSAFSGLSVGPGTPQTLFLLCRSIGIPENRVTQLPACFCLLWAKRWVPARGWKSTFLVISMLQACIRQQPWYQFSAYTSGLEAMPGTLPAPPSS